MDEQYNRQLATIWRALLALTIIFVFGGVAISTPVFGWAIWLLGFFFAGVVWLRRPQSSQRLSTPSE